MFRRLPAKNRLPKTVYTGRLFEANATVNPEVDVALNRNDRVSSVLVQGVHVPCFTHPLFSPLNPAA